MTPQEIVRIAAPYTNRVSDAFRRACGVPMRCGWMPYTVIRGEDYDDYQRRLREAYSGE